MMAIDALRVLAEHGGVVRFSVRPDVPSVRVMMPSPLHETDRVVAINLLGDNDAIDVLTETVEEVMAEVEAARARRGLRLVEP